MMDTVWVLQDLDTGAELAFTAQHLAMHAAEKIVGNRAVSGTGDILLYGPGNGTTRVMVRRFTRDEVRRMWPDISIPL